MTLKIMDNICEIKVVGESSKEVNADRLRVLIQLAIESKDKALAIEVYNSFISQIQDYLSNTNEEFRIKNSKIRVLDTPDEVKNLLGLIVDKSGTDKVYLCNTIDLEITYNIDILNKILDMSLKFNQDKSNKRIHIYSNVISNPVFSDTLINKTKSDLINNAYESACLKIESLLDYQSNLDISGLVKLNPRYRARDIDITYDNNDTYRFRAAKSDCNMGISNLDIPVTKVISIKVQVIFSVI